MYIHIYIYIYTDVYIYMYICICLYIYREREIDRYRYRRPGSIGVLRGPHRETRARSLKSKLSLQNCPLKVQVSQGLGPFLQIENF